jgi:hypothetical protein
MKRGKGPPSPDSKEFSQAFERSSSLFLSLLSSSCEELTSIQTKPIRLQLHNRDQAGQALDQSHHFRFFIQEVINRFIQQQALTAVGSPS